MSLFHHVELIQVSDVFHAFTISKREHFLYTIKVLFFFFLI